MTKSHTKCVRQKIKLICPRVWGRAPTNGIEDKLPKGYRDALLANSNMSTCIGQY